MNKQKQSTGGNLYITYLELPMADDGTKQSWFYDPIKQTEKLLETYYSKGKFVDSFKRVKSIERAKDIMLSHNPSNIKHAVFEPFSGVGNVKLKTELFQEWKSNGGMGHRSIYKVIEA